MIRIISDTSALYSPAQAKEMGMDISPLIVTIHHHTYREFVDIEAKEFLNLIKEGHLPTSSQPSIGEKLDLYEQYAGDEIIDLTMADGLSGTYQSACGAKESCDHANHIHVVNTQTLCGPHRYLVEKALRLSKECSDVNQLLEALNESISNSESYLLPQDFNYLKRGGRLTALSATIGGLLKIVPVMTLTKGPVKKLDNIGLKRTFKGACQLIAQTMKEHGVDKQHLITISHALCEEKALIAKEILSRAFPECEIQILLLSPAFITQGGPDCVAIQSILK